jgi:RimJ/RimL family protein N-acetyltransferase
VAAADSIKGSGRHRSGFAGRAAADKHRMAIREQARASVAEKVSIRTAQPGDGAALMRAVAQIDAETEFLGVPGQPHPWAAQPDVELRTLNQYGRGVVLLAEGESGAIVGYLSAFCGHFARNNGSVFIAVVGLREAWRGQGIGTRLFEEIETWARLRRAWRLELRVSSLNERGLALYRKRCFAIEGSIRRGVFRRGAWTDDFWMGKLLEPMPGEPPTVPAQEPGRVRNWRAVKPLVREMRAGDGPAFRAWEIEACESAASFAVKQTGEVAPAEAIERDIAGGGGDPRLWLVATVPRGRRSERIVGFATGSIEFGFRMQNDAFVSLTVLPEWSGQGVGRTLHERVERWACGQGVRRLTAAVQAPNLTGRAFAAALGYDEEVTMRCYSLVGGRMVDRLRLGKLLEA